jgi:hypothetical protein
VKLARAPFVTAASVRGNRLAEMIHRIANYRYFSQNAEHLMGDLVGRMKKLEMPDVTPALMQTVIDGVLKEANGKSVEQLAHAENEVLLGLLALRAKAGSTLP